MPNTLPAVDPTNSVYPPGMAVSLAALSAQGDAILTFPVGFATADAAVLFTVPTGLRLQIGRAFWEVTTGFTGGASSAIGISSNNTKYNTKGDLLGGVAGDVAATLVAGFSGTVGTKTASLGLVVLNAGDVIRFDRITSAFTAGAGLVHVPVQLVPAS